MNFEHEMTVTGATINREKKGGNYGEVGSNITLRGDVVVDKLVGLFATEDEFESILGNLYDEKDALRSPRVDSIAMKIELDDVTAKFSGPVVQDERLELTRCKFADVVFKPKHGRAVEFSARIYGYPGDEEWKIVAGITRKLLVVSLEGGAVPAPAEKKGGKQGSLTLSNGSAPDAAATH